MKLRSDTSVELFNMVYGEEMFGSVEDAMEGDLKKAYGLITEQTKWEWNHSISVARDNALKIAQKNRLAARKAAGQALDSDSDDEDVNKKLAKMAKQKKKQGKVKLD